MTISDLISRQATTQPNAIAIVSADIELTWLALAEQVDGAAEHFSSQQVGPDSHFALNESNSVEYIITLLALWQLGATVTLFSHRFPNELVSSLIETTKPPQGAPSGVVIFTSGTTQVPKAALLSCENLYYNALGSNERLPFQPGDRWLLSLPLYHVGGLGILFRALLNGGTIAVPAVDMNLSDAINQFQPTHLSLVPTQLYRLLEQHQKLKQTTSATTALLGGAPLSPQLAERAIDAGLILYASYGLTEMGSQICTKRITKVKDSVGCGSPLNYRQLRIANTGEILVKGETRFQGYIDDNSLRLPVDTEGWFATGDIGYMDEHGSLHVTGRKDNMFISGGENIHPEEIESALLNIEGVREAIVVPITDPEFGSRPVAFVLCEGVPPFNEVSIRKKLDETSLPKFKFPTRFFDWPKEIPVDQMKLNRKQFKEIAGDLVKQKA